MHCTTSYPAKKEEINLNAMNMIKKKFGVNIGYSDHSEGTLVSIAASLLGATIIERHITLNKKLRGPDHSSSLEPNEFKKLIDNINDLKKILGTNQKIVSKTEKINKKYIRKSIYAKTSIKKGTRYTNENLILKRPQIGMKPKDMKKILGRKSKKNYNFGQIINE